MPVPDFIIELREKVGHAMLWLSGATAEFCSMWHLLMAGPTPFVVENGELVCRLRPALPGAWFDIREGLYSVVRPAHPGVMTQECASLLDRMLSCDVRRLGDVGLNRDRRSEFLNAMLAYFGYHLDAISAVQSVRILKEVF